MSQGIFSALEYLENQVENITPKTDAHHGFVATNRGTGHTIPLEERANSTRFFEMRIDGLAQDDGFLLRLMNEDCSALINTLKGPQYDLSTTGIVSLIPLEATIQTILDQQGERLAFILSLPFDLLYLEA